MKRFAAALAACCGLCLWFGLAGCQVAPQQFQAPGATTRLSSSKSVVARAPASQPADAAPEQPFPVPIVDLRGTPAEIGAAHGRRLSGQIRLLHDAYLGIFIHGSFERLIALSAAAKFETQLLPEHRDEIAALAAQVGLDERDAMLGQCFLDLIPMTACSTVALSADAAPDGVARLGRNLDFPSLNVADKYTTVFVYHPAGRYAFVSIGWPGMIGVLSGINEHGLTIANMEVTRGPRLPGAMPYTLLYRTILEQCSTTKEAIALLERTPRQTSNNLTIMDATGNRAVAEIFPGGVQVRRGDATAPWGLISTNHRRGQDASTPGRCWRYDSLRAASERGFGHIDPATIEAMLGRASPGQPTLQSMVFEPATRVLYLSAGADAAHGAFHRLDLKPLFDSSPSALPSSAETPAEHRPSASRCMITAPCAAAPRPWHWL